jgi:hypothetical protein
MLAEYHVEASLTGYPYNRVTLTVDALKSDLRVSGGKRAEGSESISRKVTSPSVDMDKNTQFQTTEIASRLLKSVTKLSPAGVIIFAKCAPVEVLDIVHRLESIDIPAAS